jgi:hypothetical protein
VDPVHETGSVTVAFRRPAHTTSTSLPRGTYWNYPTSG